MLKGRELKNNEEGNPEMISLKCPKCGFFFSVSLPEDISEKDREEAFTCPCGAMMEEVPLSKNYIPTIKFDEEGEKKND